VAGGEALYADMGHFGRRPIAQAWYAIVLPGLVLNYFGQAALLGHDPEAVESPFYRLAPEWGITPLLVGLLLLVQMATWRQGRQLVAARLHRGERSAADLFDDTTDVAIVDGTAIFLFKDPGQAPPALVGNLRHNKVRHADTYLVALEITDAPHVDDDDRRTVSTVRPGLHQVVLRYGYLDEIDVPTELARRNGDDAPVDDGDATYFVGREAVSQGDLEGMHPALEHVYVLLHRGADSATRFFKLPTDRVFDVGTPVEI